MTPNFEIKLISTVDTLPLRKNILKPFLSEQECINPGDDSDDTYHFGLFHKNELITVATFLQEAHPNLSSHYPYRLRGMATHSLFHGQGFGQALMNHSMQFLKMRGCDLIWCNAREKAFSFYEKLGFLYSGNYFDLPRIGPHKVMYKLLIPK
jgi:predicted GNAT family N-acyltransferase